MLGSWNDGPAKAAIVEFVGRVTAVDGPDFVAPEARVAVFDNDGTLWAEKPAYIQLDFRSSRTYVPWPSMTKPPSNFSTSLTRPSSWLR
jgi:hypothetical protein